MQHRYKHKNLQQCFPNFSSAQTIENILVLENIEWGADSFSSLFILDITT